MLFVFPGLTYMTTDQKDQSLPGLLDLTWPTAGKYHSKPFLPTKPLSVSLPVGACELQALTILDQLFNQSPHLYQWWPENTGDMVDPGI